MNETSSANSSDAILEKKPIGRAVAWIANVTGYKRIKKEQVFYFCAYFCLALLFTTLYMKSLAPYRRATLHKLTTFTADTPFQYRVLFPYIANVIWRHTHWHLHSIYSIITALSTFALLAAFRKYLMLFISEKAASLGAMLILYPMLWNYGSLPSYYLPSDIPAIAFFVYGITLIYTERWWTYFPVFIAATINRETSCFLACGYAFTMFGKQKPKVYITHLLAQAVIWFSIKHSIDKLFIHNGGKKLFENQIWNNIHFFKHIFQLEPHALWRLYTFGFIWILVPFFWKKQPLFFKKLLWIFVPFLAGMSIVGRLQEVRIYSELIPILTAPAVYTIYNLIWDKPNYIKLPLD